MHEKIWYWQSILLRQAETERYQGLSSSSARKKQTNRQRPKIKPRPTLTTDHPGHRWQIGFIEMRKEACQIEYH